MPRAVKRPLQFAAGREPPPGTVVPLTLSGKAVVVWVPTSLGLLAWFLRSAHVDHPRPFDPGLYSGVVVLSLVGWAAALWRFAHTYDICDGQIRCWRFGALCWTGDLQTLVRIEERTARGQSTLLLQWPEVIRRVLLPAEDLRRCGLELVLSEVEERAELADPPSHGDSDAAADVDAEDSDAQDTPEWACGQCKADNPGNFYQCWKCGADRPDAGAK